SCSPWRRLRTWGNPARGRWSFAHSRASAECSASEMANKTLSFAGFAILWLPTGSFGHRKGTSMTHLVLLAFTTCVTAAPVDAGDCARERLDNWHHWRGPEANGTAPRAKPPLAWDDKKNIRWKAELPGKGSATPTVWGEQVFVVTAIKTDRVADAKD